MQLAVKSRLADYKQLCARIKRIVNLFPSVGGYGFPPGIFSYEVWLYFRFNLNHRDIEDLLAQRERTLDTIHDTSQYANNRAELSHQSTRVRERVMRRFKSAAQISDCWLSMPQSTISSILEGIVYGPGITENWG